MKVQTKITLLLLMVMAIFLGALFAFRTYEKRKFRHIARERSFELQKSFEGFLRRQSELMRAKVEEDTCLDRMTNAINTEDYQWLGENFNDGTLTGFQANAIWICRPDGSVLYAFNNLHLPELQELPFPKAQLAPLFARAPLRHFFIRAPRGEILEIAGGTVHPSKDFARQTSSQGYFLAARRWNNAALTDMAFLTGNEIRFGRPHESLPSLGQRDGHSEVVFTRTLPGPTNQPIASLIVRNESKVVASLTRSSDMLFAAFLVFAFLIVLLIFTALTIWVRRPLQAITRSLNRGGAGPAPAIGSRRSEFGEIARTLQQIFAQRGNLISEMEERRATEEALRESEDRLRHAHKMEAVGRLAGGVAHDFNNLLTAIIGYAELIMHRGGNAELVRHQAELIHKAGKQAAGLTRQLLAFSRKQLLQPRVLDLNSLLGEMEELLRRIIGEQYDIVTRPDAQDGRVKADPNQLEQVILNLGVNARDAMPSGGRIEIATSNVQLDHRAAAQMDDALPPGDYVLLCVTDSGGGMNAETQSRIFEPFFTTKGPGQGTGLGLATVYGIVRQSGGGISVESEPGRGSRFFIYLPLETAPIDESRPAPTSAAGVDNSETILVVEDEEIVRELMCDALAGQGYRILCAMHGPEALRMVADFADPIDLLVTDVIMPEMNGHVLAQQLCAVRPGLKVLFVSGYSDNDISHHGVLDSQIELLEKPFTPEALARKVREVIGAQTTTRVSEK